MRKGDLLRSRIKQHLPKNTLSKGDDKRVSLVMDRLVQHLKERYRLSELGFYLEYVSSIKLSELIGIIKGYDKRIEFASLTNNESFMKPDGGILLLRRVNEAAYKRVVIAVEMKHQGTNDKRIAEGLKKQAQGNAIERLGKNLIGIRATLQYEKVTPFVCFGWGVDFAEGSGIRDRVITMNEFYPLNRVFVHKREGYAPVSMFFREQEWGEQDLFDVMKEIAEASITAYIY